MSTIGFTLTGHDIFIFLFVSRNKLVLYGAVNAFQQCSNVPFNVLFSVFMSHLHFESFLVISGVIFQEVILKGVIFKGVIFQEVILKGVIFKMVIFQEVKLKGVIFRGGPISMMIFPRIIFQGVIFQGVIFKGVCFQEVIFQGVKFVLRSP